jgi:hypothetical protein
MALLALHWFNSCVLHNPLLAWGLLIAAKTDSYVRWHYLHYTGLIAVRLLGSIRNPLLACTPLITGFDKPLCKPCTGFSDYPSTAICRTNPLLAWVLLIASLNPVYIRWHYLHYTGLIPVCCIIHYLPGCF